MKNETGMHLLWLLQCLYQQKLISNNEKQEIANLIRLGMTSGNFSNLLHYLESIKDDENKHLISDMENIVRRN